MKRMLLALFLSSTVLSAQSAGPKGPHVATSASVRVTYGEIAMPTYEHTGRELQPPLFPSSAVTGLYPFPTYKMPLKPEPKPQTYKAVFIENEYLKLTYLPEFGGRFLEMYDKLRKRQVFYKNDVLKPTQLNARGDWPQEGIELTGPYDTHSLTMRFDPYWSNLVLHNPDGSITIRLGETDPIYGMTVRYSATLHPGVAALEISTFCFNPNKSRMPQMFWSNAAFPTTEQTQFIYPMTRTVGHNTGEVTDWPMYQGVDDSWDRNNKNMLGVFGIDLYDNFGGAYMYDRDYGVFRFADRRVVQGMKMWTFGHGPDAASMEAAYTDKAGPYYEAQSGRHVWDGHYEWVAPHQVEEWHEWWIPVGGTQGLSTITGEAALHVVVKGSVTGSEVKLAISPVTRNPNASLVVRDASGVLLEKKLTLQPGVVLKETAATKSVPKDLTVTLRDAGGALLLQYAVPNSGEKRSEYSAFTRELEKPSKTPEQMSAEELVLAAESHLKDLDDKAALDLLDIALKRDGGYSIAHKLKGIVLYKEGKLKEAELELQAAVSRDPYADEAWYYLSMSQLDQDKRDLGERNLYYIWPASAYYGNREYQLGRIEFLRGAYTKAIEHLKGSLNSNGNDLSARHLLALTYRVTWNRALAKGEIDNLLKVDPSHREGLAERMFLAHDPKAAAELKRLMGDQSQEALHVAEVYGDVERWADAVSILRLVDGKNSDPWGTSSIFYYTLAYNLQRAGQMTEASAAREQAKQTAKTVDRFPYLPSSEAPLRAAVRADSKDTLALYDLGCLLYSLGNTDEAIHQWETAAAVDPNNFNVQRSLGMAHAENGDTADAIRYLQHAVALDETHLGTINDLVTLYAKAGRFEEELKLLHNALQHTGDKDDLMRRLLQVELVQGDYVAADEIVKEHTFSPRHRDYSLRELYRALKYAEGARAFHRKQYDEALSLFHAVEEAPPNLGIDDFVFQSTARLQYALGKTYAALGKKDEARESYEKSIRVVDLTAGDRASYNSDNFYMLLSMRELGRKQEAADLAVKFEEFAESQKVWKRVHRLSEGKYVQGQVALFKGDKKEAVRFMRESLAIEPDFLQPRMDLRGDSVGTDLK
jgi:tetratricopeptide (TPR) repeat protein